MERLSYKSNDPSMTEEITKVRELINTMIENVETKDQVNGLKESLHSLSSKADTKLVGIPTNKIWNLKEVLFSTYCMDKRSKDGIDPVKSMIGYLDPDKKILMVKPEYQEQVLRSLKAVSLNNNSYKIHSVSASFVPVSYNINIINWNINIPYRGDFWAEELMRRMALDTSRGTRLTTHRDSSGTWYVFYKDARCVISRNASEDKCHEVVQSVNGGPYVTSYITTKSNAITKCKKGTDFCTEIYAVDWVVHKYQDINCTRMIDVMTIYGFSCW